MHKDAINHTPKFNVQTCFSQFLWFFSLKCDLKIRKYLEFTEGLPNACKLMCFVKNIYGNRNVKFLECDYLLVQWCTKLTLTPLPSKCLRNKYMNGPYAYHKKSQTCIYLVVCSATTPRNA